MESYRDALYRYSTGEGFNAAILLPEVAGDVSSFKMDPLVHNLINAEVVVCVKREADRVSMQDEDGMRQMKNLGFDPEMGRQLVILKDRVKLLRILMTKYNIHHILREDLETLYDLYPEGFETDPLILEVLWYNLNPAILRKYENTTRAGSKSPKSRNMYNRHDTYGRKLGKANMRLYRDSQKGGLSGFGQDSIQSSIPITAIAIVAILLLYFLK